MSMKSADLCVVLSLLVLLAGSSAAQAFGFCFSFGGGGKHRSDYYRGPPPPAGFGPGIYQAYPYSPVFAGPYGSGGFYPPPPPMPQYEKPAKPDETRQAPAR